MSHVFEVTDEQYKAIEEVAKERGQAPEVFFRAWVEAVQLYTEDEAADPDQSWFWTPEWQQKEAEADADQAEDRVVSFATTDEMFDALDTYATEIEATRNPNDAHQ